jgi:hypothetical protein
LITGADAAVVMLDREEAPVPANVPVVFRTTWENLVGTEGLSHEDARRLVGAARDRSAGVQMDSDVPRPYGPVAWWGLHFGRAGGASAILRLESEFDARLPALAVVISNCVSWRMSFLIALSQSYPVHFLGRCKPTMLSLLGLTKSFGTLDKKATLAKYLFAGSFENSQTLDYVTEKAFDAFDSGAVPVYFGAPNVFDFVPDHSVVAAGQSSPETVARTLAGIASSKARWMEYQHWRASSNPPEHMKDLYALFSWSFPCRLCNCVRGNLGCS